MHGYLFIIPPLTSVEEDQKLRLDAYELTAPPTLDALQKAVDGDIELVPFFRTIEFDGGVKRCAAFCNENGKNVGLPYNEIATHLWADAILREMWGSFDTMNDHLVGAIAIVIGDDDLMLAL